MNDAVSIATVTKQRNFCSAQVIHASGAKHLQRAIFNDSVIREKWRWAGQGMVGCGTTSHATIDGQRRTDVAGQLATTSKISGPPALIPARHRDPRGLHDGLLHASPLSTTHWNRRRRCPACPAGLQWTRHVGGLAGPRWSEEGKGKGCRDGQSVDTMRVRGDRDTPGCIRRPDRSHSDVSTASGQITSVGCQAQ